MAESTNKTKIEAPPVFFNNLYQTFHQDALSMLIYGGAGTGKTWFAGTAGDRNLIINIGKGTRTLKSIKFQKRFGSNPIVVDISEQHNGKMIPDRATAFDLVSDTIDYAIATMGDRFDTVTIDEATALRRYGMFKALELAQKLKNSKGLANSREFDVVMPDVGDYGAEMSMVEQFIAGYIDITKAANKNLIVLAHERHIYGKAAKIGEPAPLLRVLPGFTGKTFPDQIMGFFDFVWHSESVGSGSQIGYRMRTEGDEALRCKTRDGGVFEVIETDLTFPKMVERIKAKQKEVTILIEASNR